MIVFIVSCVQHVLRNSSLLATGILDDVSAGSVESSQSSQEESLSSRGAESQSLDGLGGVGGASSDVLVGVMETGS